MIPEGQALEFSAFPDEVHPEITVFSLPLHEPIAEGSFGWCYNGGTNDGQWKSDLEDCFSDIPGFEGFDSGGERQTWGHWEYTTGEAIPRQQGRRSIRPPRS